MIHFLSFSGDRLTCRTLNWHTVFAESRLPWLSRIASGPPHDLDAVAGLYNNRAALATGLSDPVRVEHIKSAYERNLHYSSRFTVGHPRAFSDTSRMRDTPGGWGNSCTRVKPRAHVLKALNSVSPFPSRVYVGGQCPLPNAVFRHCVAFGSHVNLRAGGGDNWSYELPFWPREQSTLAKWYSFSGFSTRQPGRYLQILWSNSDCMS